MKKNVIKTSFILSFLLIFLISLLSGCQTMKGNRYELHDDENIKNEKNDDFAMMKKAREEELNRQETKNTKETENKIKNPEKMKRHFFLSSEGQEVYDNLERSSN
ncbi:MAG: hypothetical protein LBQ54_08080 [Planctomycetaceae bacterium]|jgi:hypothetical protein|nr:hypothetical protein [Planctomycetaceae bacterium]